MQTTTYKYVQVDTSHFSVLTGLEIVYHLHWVSEKISVMFSIHQELIMYTYHIGGKMEFILN